MRHDHGVSQRIDCHLLLQLLNWMQIARPVVSEGIRSIDI